MAWLLAATVPLGAQTRRPPAIVRDDTPQVSLRPFFLVTGERFAAKTTFESTFGDAVQSFWGGGLQVVTRAGPYVEIAASRFRQTGERVFRGSGGEVFRLGIPLTATITPVEVTGGFRSRATRRLFPYGGAGIGRYAYSESAEFSEAGENVETSQVGYLLVGGVEVRAHRWVGFTLDVQYTHISGILGAGGLSKEVNEDNLGGVAARLKVVIGR